MKTLSIAATFRRLARQSFVNVAVALILLLLPMEVLFRLSSWTLFMPASDIAKEVAMMILMMSLVSAIVALLVAGIGCALVKLPFRKEAEKTEETVCASIAIGILAIIVWFFVKMLAIWLHAAAGITFTTDAAEILLVVGILVVWVRKYGVVPAGNTIRSRLANGGKLALILIVSAGLIVATKGVNLHDYNEIKINANPTPRAGMSNVILLSIDTLSAEDMSLYGYSLPTTPRLEAFARESYVFDSFFSSSNWTTPSVASFISGLYPITSGVRHSEGYFLDVDRKKNLGQALTDNGYQTAAIVVNGYAHPLALRIAESFSAVSEPPVPTKKILFSQSALHTLSFQLLRLENYLTYVWLKELVRNLVPSLFPPTRTPIDQKYDKFPSSLWPPELVFSRALPFFDLLKKPQFIWAHIFPPHSPYRPSAPFKRTFVNVNDEDLVVRSGEYAPGQQIKVDQQRLLYDEFILDTDSRVGGLLDKLKAMGRFDDSIIIITADHGESFTKNWFRHGGPHLYQPLIHIPLMIHLPGQKEGKRIPFFTGQVDLLPTVMDLLDLPISQWAEGESLKASMLEGKPTSMPKFSMNLEQGSRFVPPRKGTVAVMQDGWKLVHYLATGKEELYNLTSDPQETADLANRDPEQAKKMRDLIYGRFNLAK